MAKVSINAENASNAFFNVSDVIEALKRFDNVLESPISDDDDDGYSIGDCLDDIKAFLQQLDEECISSDKN